MRVKLKGGSLSGTDGYIDIFHSNSHEYSYVLTDKSGYLKEIKEKVLISNLATSGLYGFSSSSMFIENFDNEIYISEIYRKMIKKGMKIATGETYSESDTLVVGTPSEYFNLSKYIK